jgi:hypothetical protein
VAGRHLPRGERPASRLVPEFSAGRPRHARPPPFKQILTHGFLIDVDGKKMSKSIGNTILPQDVIKESGADIIRLWTAMSDYREEIRVGKEILARVSEAYRKLRNTLRYLLGNLYDFDPVKDIVPLAEMEEVDRYILARYADVAKTRARGLRGVRVRADLPGVDAVRHGGPEFVLQRHLEGRASTRWRPTRASGGRPRRRCM